MATSQTLEIFPSMDLDMMFYQAICAVFLMILKSTLCSPCDRAEYETNGECCPMCSPGTDSTDTECEICPENSFSSGSSTSCTPHTDCESKGLPTVKPGDSVSDSQCGEKNWAPLIVWIVVGIIVVLFLVGGVTLYKSGFCSKKNNLSKPGPLQQDQECQLQQSEESEVVHKQIPDQIRINLITNQQYFAQD
ncbi:tumor necrosis factor receptor superfamily member 5-like isoform X4 [Scleropages formosus]|uniref:tumor necrosis factor receptor superfamily member 5-like isoform X4 n=1 Tax=Scleropages formosus TaxID=113540 RepID=UPI0010FA9188|nr:tumor necrosis factor receptor superfamily member 5-like isoform X4 [Scleropages formosus]